MKQLFTFLLIICLGITIYAQDKIFVHTATAANISGHITYMDHPDLNNNPSANIVYKHVWNPNGEITGVYNDNIDGLWYNGIAGRWTIYNEDISPMVEGAQFFVYIGSNNDDFITHIASVANQHPISASASVITDPDFTVFEGPYAVMSNYFNPNGVYNPHNYAFFYDDIFTNTRNIYTEGGENIPTDAAFKILKNGTGIIARFTAQSTAANINNNYFLIDNPNLNNNPDAAFVFQHYYGVNGPSSEQAIDAVLSAWYAPVVGRWGIYREDFLSAMPEGVAVDIIVATREVLGVDDNNITSVSLFPNPAKETVTVTTQNRIDTVSIFNMLGQEVLKTNDGDSNTIQINIASLAPGNYIAKVQTGNAVQNIKLIKN